MADKKSKKSDVIQGLKLIRHNFQGVNNPDDHSFPWRLDVKLRPPRLLSCAALAVGGYEEICVRGLTRKAIHQFVEMNKLKTQPRLVSLEIANTKTSG